MIQTTDGVILRSGTFRETSQLLTFLTQDFGKIHTLAKGVRRLPKRFASTFELFTCNRIVFYERRLSGLQLLSQCDLIDSYASIRSDLQKTACAVYFLELVDRATELGDPSHSLYALLLSALKTLSVRKTASDVLRLFEVKLLVLSGLFPEIFCCQQCRQKVAYSCSLSLHKGGILCRRCEKGEKDCLPLSRGTLESLRHMAASPWPFASRLRILQKGRKEVETVLTHCIDFYLDEKIYSRDFLKGVGVL